MNYNRNLIGRFTQKIGTGLIWGTIFIALIAFVLQLFTFNMIQDWKNLTAHDLEIQDVEMNILRMKYQAEMKQMEIRTKADMETILILADTTTEFGQETLNQMRNR